MPSKRKASGRPRGRPPKDDPPKDAPGPSQTTPAGPSGAAAPKDKRVVSFADEHTRTPAGAVQGNQQQLSSTVRKEPYGKYAESATSTDILQKDTQNRDQATTSNVTSQSRHTSHGQHQQTRQTHSPPPAPIQGRQNTMRQDAIRQDAMRQPTHSPPPAAITVGQGQSSQTRRPPQLPAFSNRPPQGQSSQNRPPQRPPPQPPISNRPPQGHGSKGKQAGKKLLRSTQSMSDIGSLGTDEAAVFDAVNQNTYQRQRENTYQREVKRTGEYFAQRTDQAQRDKEARQRQTKTFEAIREGEDEDGPEAVTGRNVAKNLRELDDLKKAAEQARRAKLPPVPPFDTSTTGTSTTGTTSHHQQPPRSSTSAADAMRSPTGTTASSLLLEKRFQQQHFQPSSPHRGSQHGSQHERGSQHELGGRQHERGGRQHQHERFDDDDDDDDDEDNIDYEDKFYRDPRNEEDDEDEDEDDEDEGLGDIGASGPSGRDQGRREGENVDEDDEGPAQNEDDEDLEGLGASGRDRGRGHGGRNDRDDRDDGRGGGRDEGRGRDGDRDDGRRGDRDEGRGHGGGRGPETPAPASRSRRRNRRRDDGRPLEQSFPEFFYPASRASLRSLQQSGVPTRLTFDPITGDYVPDGTEPETPLRVEDLPKGIHVPNDHPSVLNEINKEVRWALFLFHHNWFCGSIVKQAVPNIDTRHKRFKDLRLYAMDIHKHLKSKFLIGSMLSFFKDLAADHPEILEYDLLGNPQHKAQFKQLIDSWLNKRTFDEVYFYITKYIDYEATFGDKRQLPFYYIKTELFDMGRVFIDVIKSENEMNRGRPRGSKRITDENARRAMRGMFESLPFDDRYIEVERNQFVDVPQEFVPKVVQPARAPDLELLQHSIVDEQPPPARPNTHPMASGWRPMPREPPTGSGSGFSPSPRPQGGHGHAEHRDRDRGGHDNRGGYDNRGYDNRRDTGGYDSRHGYGNTGGRDDRGGYGYDRGGYDSRGYYEGYDRDYDRGYDRGYDRSYDRRGGQNTGGQGRGGRQDSFYDDGYSGYSQDRRHGQDRQHQDRGYGQDRRHEQDRRHDQDSRHHQDRVHSQNRDTTGTREYTPTHSERQRTIPGGGRGGRRDVDEDEDDEGPIDPRDRRRKAPLGHGGGGHGGGGGRAGMSKSGTGILDITPPIPRRTRMPGPAPSPSSTTLQSATMDSATLEKGMSSLHL